MRISSALIRSRILALALGISLLGIVAIVLALRLFFDSLYASSQDRINIALWGPQSYVLSLARIGNQHYVFRMSNTYTVQVPGGLKGYSIGSLGKLASLERDPQLFMKAMGEGTGVFIHTYLFDPKPTIYYEDTWSEEPDLSDTLAYLRQSVWYAGDMNIIDRIWMYGILRSMKPAHVSIYTLREKSPEVLLYDKHLRDEQKLVQVGYQRSLSTATFLARILERNGIRVSDITRADSLINPTECQIVEAEEPHSTTALFLADYFDCEIKTGETGLYDIYWLLNDAVERNWAM